MAKRYTLSIPEDIGKSLGFFGTFLGYFGTNLDEIPDSYDLGSMLNPINTRSEHFVKPLR